jgi:site-specific DNA-methyltransferase (adenine-specific)
MDAVTLHHGDALDVLRGMADNSVDAVVTDPPSGIGFMGKTWDHDHGGRDGWVKAFAAIFAECLRVVKPGGHAFVWALPRTSHWTACALEDAGWTVREKVYHLFGSGFPKSHNLPGGIGTALKPAAEEWILARKPLVGTVAANVQAWGTGALNIEASRVGTGDSLTRPYIVRDDNQVYGKGLGAGVQTPPAGRWPPNVALSHSEQCERVGTRRVRGATAVRHNSGGNTFGGDNRKPPLDDMTYADADGLETVDEYRCVDGCPVRALAEQSGVSKSTGGQGSLGAFRNGDVYGKGRDERWKADPGYGDTGTAARFFPNFEASPMDALDAPWLYTAKASRREREAGLEGMEGKPQGQRYGTVQDARPHTRDGYEYPRQPMRNTHPTVKSLALMRWLCRLITPPGGVVLDCFLGSGTTGMAAVLEGFRFIGVEQDAEYIEIARRRIAWAQEQEPPLLRATGD